MARLPPVSTLLNEAFAIFGREWKHLASAIVLLGIPLYLVGLGLESSVALLTPYVFLLAIIGPLISIITTIIVAHSYQKDTLITSKTIYQYIHERFFPVLGTSVVLGIVFILSMLILLVPGALLGIIYTIFTPALEIAAGVPSAFTIISGIILGLGAIIIATIVGTYLLFAVYITVLTKKWGFPALRQSYHMVKGRWWNVFGRIFIIQLVGMVIGSIVYVFGEAFVGSSALGTFIISLLQQVALIPISIAMIVFYLYMKEVKLSKSTVKKTIPEQIKTKSVSVRKTAPKKKSSKKKSTTKRTKKKATTKRAKKKVARRR